MRKFIGLLTLESLSDQAPLQGLEPLTEQVLLVPGEKGESVRHVRWYWLTEDELQQRLASLAAALRPGWHAHFWAGDDLRVLLSGRVFRARTSGRDTWQEFIDYGRSLGINSGGLEHLPVAVPDFVREALAAASDEDPDLPWGNPYCCEA